MTKRVMGGLVSVIGALALGGCEGSGPSCSSPSIVADLQKVEPSIMTPNGMALAQYRKSGDRYEFSNIVTQSTGPRVANCKASLVLYPNPKYYPKPIMSDEPVFYAVEITDGGKTIVELR